MLQKPKKGSYVEYTPFTDFPTPLLLQKSQEEYSNSDRENGARQGEQGQSDQVKPPPPIKLTTEHVEQAQKVVDQVRNDPITR